MRKTAPASVVRVASEGMPTRSLPEARPREVTFLKRESSSEGMVSSGVLLVRLWRMRSWPPPVRAMVETRRAPSRAMTSPDLRFELGEGSTGMSEEEVKGALNRWTLPLCVSPLALSRGAEAIRSEP